MEIDRLQPYYAAMKVQGLWGSWVEALTHLQRVDIETMLGLITALSSAEGSGHANLSWLSRYIGYQAYCQDLGGKVSTLD